MGGDRDAGGQNSLMMRAAQLSNAQPAWMLLWPKDLLSWNEFNPAKKCWYVLWPCSRNWSSALILTNTGCARTGCTRVRQALLSRSRTSTRTIDKGSKAILGKILAGKQNFDR